MRLATLFLFIFFLSSGCTFASKQTSTNINSGGMRNVNAVEAAIGAHRYANQQACLKECVQLYCPGGQYCPTENLEETAACEDYCEREYNK